MIDSRSIIDPPRLKPLPYFIIGFSLVVIKFIIDRVVASMLFGRSWSIYNYVIPIGAYRSPTLGAFDEPFLLTMVGIAVPFVVVGLILTSRRLRDAELSQGMLILFFIPVINLLFFITLSLSQSSPGKIKPPFAGRVMEGPPLEVDYQPLKPMIVGRFVPESNSRSIITSAALIAPLGPLMAAIGVFAFKNYGWGLFVGMPFVAGMLAALLHGWNQPRTIGSCVTTSIFTVFLGTLAIFLFAIEGALCLIFLMPLAMPIGIIGGITGYAIQSARWARVSAGNLLILIIVLLVIMGAERALRDQPEVFKVTTSVDVDAPPEAVWNNVVTFSEIAPPKELLFSTGIAYPLRARIEGSGVGAVRYCEFTTGSFVEPIEVWDQPNLLKFSVTQNPPPMKEWSLFKIRPPHLENFLMSHGGQFKLTPLPGNRTRLEGTTWYEHRMWPEAYWSIWTDWVIHQIHGRVLNHVKTLSEHPVQAISTK